MSEIERIYASVLNEYEYGKTNVLIESTNFNKAFKYDSDFNLFLGIIIIIVVPNGIVLLIIKRNYNINSSKKRIKMAANIEQCRNNLADLCWDNSNQENIAIQYLDRGNWIEIYQGTDDKCSIPSQFSNGETVTFGLSVYHEQGSIPPPTIENQNTITLTGLPS